MKLVQFKVLDLEVILESLPSGAYLLSEDDNSCIMKVVDYEDFKIYLNGYIDEVKEVTIK